MMPISWPKPELPVLQINTELTFSLIWNMMRVRRFEISFRFILTCRYLKYPPELRMAWSLSDLA